MPKLVLLRHGESQWNLENRFTGWIDVDLSENGLAEAARAGRTLKEHGFLFDRAHTSVLKRAIRTLWLSLSELDQMWLPITHSWRLNERHYGALTGLNKADTLQKFGEEQFTVWRRSFDVPPPAMTDANALQLVDRSKYAGIQENEIPRTECVKDVIARVVPYWNREIAPQIKQGQRLLIVAHGNSLRAIVTHLDQLSPEAVVKLNIPTGIPLVYELDDDLKPVRHHYLGDPAEIQKAIDKVAHQGKK